MKKTQKQLQNSLSNQGEIEQFPGFQNFGFVIITDQNLIIESVTKNIEKFLGEPALDFISKKLSEKIHFSDISSISEITSYISSSPEFFHVALNNDGHSYWLRAYRCGEHLIFEFEKAFYTQKALGLKLAYEAINEFRTCTIMEDLLYQISKNVRLVTEYERVMVARFDQEMNADVLAESTMESCEESSLLGSWISNELFGPNQIAHLNAVQIRMIVDAQSKSVDLKPNIEDSSLFVASNLVASEPKKLRYLKKNNIRSAILLPLKIKGELWGFIACFSTTPKRVSLRVREAAVTLTHIASTCIENLASQYARKLAAKMEDNLYLLSNILNSNTQDLEEVLAVNSDYFSQFTDCHGFAVVSNTTEKSHGTTPDKEQLKDLRNWLNENCKEGVFNSRTLSKQYDRAKKFDNGTVGLLALSPSEESNLWLFWFLDEEFARQSRLIDPVEVLYAEKLKERLLKHSLATAVKTKEKIEADREFLASIVESSKDAIIGFAETGSVVSWNTGAVELFQLEADDVIGSSMTEIFGNDSDIQSLLEVDPSDTLEKTVTRKDGQTLELSIKVYPINVKEKNPIFGAAMIRDITAQKQAERELLLMSQQLVESNKQLEEYAWVAAHDLKEPVRTMGTYAKLVYNEYTDKLDEDGKEMLNAIYGSAESAMNRIDDILSYSSLGRNELTKTKVDLNLVIAKVEKDLIPAIKESGTKLTYSKLPIVMGDFDLLTLMFQNLISNAIKFRSEAKTKIEIKAEVKDSMVKISVLDNGIGIDMKYKEKIFGMFKRLNPNYPGTGLGLSIVKRIVDLHGGKIKLESAPGKGTTFFIELHSQAD